MVDCSGGVDGGSDAGLCTDATVWDVCGGLDDGTALSETSSAIGISSSILSLDEVVVVVVVAEMIGAFCAGVVVVDDFESTDVGCSSKDVDATE